MKLDKFIKIMDDAIEDEKLANMKQGAIYALATAVERYYQENHENFCFFPIVMAYERFVKNNEKYSYLMICAPLTIENSRVRQCSLVDFKNDSIKNEYYLEY